MGMNFDNLTEQAKKIVEDRGGVDALKDDAAELKDIATGQGSLTDKAKAAVAAVKDPGAKGEDPSVTSAARGEDPPAKNPAG